jgi:AraC-like DNA-binding protein
MWEVAERRWARPALGLSAAGMVPVGAYEVLDYLILSSATLGDGLAQFAEYFAIATRTAAYEIHRRRQQVSFEMAWRMPPRGIMFQLRDYSLAVVACRVRAACGCRPSAVELSGPPLAAADAYARAFGAPATLRAKRSALIFSPDTWSAPQPRRDADLNRTLRRHAQLLLERTSAADAESLGARVRAEWLRRIRVGPPSITEIAGGLGMGARTLQRRLRLEGVSFGDLAEELRAGLAREYVADRRLNVSEAAYLLGFSEPSAFSRAYKRWTGMSPQAFRSVQQERGR